METLNDFVKRLSENVGCYSHICKSGIASLKKNKANIRLEMAVFAWVRELKRKGVFEVATYEDLAVKAGVNQSADGIKPRMHWIHTGIVFFVANESTGNDFTRAVSVLKEIQKIK